MEEIEEVEGETGLFQVKKIKVLLRIEAFSNFYRITDSKGKMSIRKEVK